MRLNPTHIMMAMCLVLASWSASALAAERASILDDYYMENPPNSAYLGKMKAKWANYVKVRQKLQNIDLMPKKATPVVSRLKPAPVVPRVKPVAKVRPQTVKVTRVVPKTVVVTKVTPKATVRRFIAPHRAVVATPNRSVARALPFWRDLPAH